MIVTPHPPPRHGTETISALETITTTFVWGLAAFAFLAGLTIPMMAIGAMIQLLERR